MEKKLKSIDILKGIGILMIIAVHNRHFIMKDMSGFRQIINYGQMGCQLFFVVSGMALCYSWYSSSKHFLLRRYLRLAPGYIIIMLINFILNVLLIDLFKCSPGFIMNREPAAIITNVFFVHGLFPDYINSVFPGGWYIGTAFILYMLFPILVSLVQKLYCINCRLPLILPVILFILNYIIIRTISKLSVGALYPYNNSFLYYFFTNHITCFSLGIILYFRKKHGLGLCCPLPVYAVLAGISGIISIYLFMMPEHEYIFCIIPSVSGIFFYMLAICFIHIEETSKHIHCRLLNFIEKCGKDSYTMYLVHSFVSWYGMKALVSFMTAHNYKYNDLVLYLVLYIPSVIAVYALNLFMKKLLNIM